VSVLTTKPLKQHQFDLAKHEFNDFLKMHVDDPLPGLPSMCPCGKPFSVNHSQNCHLGGFIDMRHDDTKELIASEMAAVHPDVEIEPELQPLTGERFRLKTTKTEDEAHPDIRTKGFWIRHQSAFFDIKVMYLNAPTHRYTPIMKALSEAEKVKRRENDQRIREVEKGSFTPLVFATNGIMGPQTQVAIKKLASTLADKTKDKHHVVLGLLRCQLAFCLLRSAITCLRGTRTRRRNGPPVERLPTDLVVAEAGIAI
jgi:hypothetical protein